MPDVEIDIDDLLDADSEEERALKLRVSSFQSLEPNGHRQVNPPGSPELGMHYSACGGVGTNSWATAVCREESDGMLGVRPQEIHL